MKSRRNAVLVAFLSILLTSPPFSAATVRASGTPISDTLLSKTSTVFAITYFPNSHEVIFAQGLYWVFFNNGTDTVYQTSKDGLSFGPLLEGRKGGACGYTTDQGQTGGTVSYCYSPSWFEVIYNATTNTLLYVNVDSTTTFFSYRIGHPSSSGSIVWAGPELLVGVNSGLSHPGLAFGPGSSMWLSLEVWNGTGNHHIRVFGYRTTWYPIADFDTGINNNVDSALLALSGGRMELVYDLNQLGSSFRFLVSSDGGKTWESYYATLGIIGWGWFDSTSLGDLSYFVGWGGSHELTLLTFDANLGTLSWQTLDSSVYSESARLVGGGNSTLEIVFNDNRAFYSVMSPDRGYSWTPVVKLFPVDYVGTMSTPVSLVSGATPVIWEGNYPPVYVHFFIAPEMGGSAGPIPKDRLSVSRTGWSDIIGTFTLSCNGASVILGSSIICKATLQGLGSVPTGKVLWSSNATGSFSSSFCRLSRHGSYSSCLVRFRPMAAGSSVVLTAKYGGNTLFTRTYSLTVTQRPSRTTVTCRPTSVVAGSTTIICTAKVTGFFPTGSVTWTQSGTGSVSPVPTFRCSCCTLNRASCSVIMTGTMAGKVTLRATYSGDSNNQGSSGAATLTVTKSTTTTTTTTTFNTSTQAGSFQGLVLRLVLNGTRMKSGNTLEINVSDYNPSSKALNISKGSTWAVTGLATGSCPSLYLPVGIAVFQGRYTNANLSEATPLRIFPLVACPMVVMYIEGYSFQPMSDNAIVLPYSKYFPMMAEVSVGGTYLGTAFNPQHITPLSPGTYTVAAGDEWGNLVLAYFVVEP